MVHILIVLCAFLVLTDPLNGPVLHKVQCSFAPSPFFIYQSRPWGWNPFIFSNRSIPCSFFYIKTRQHNWLFKVFFSLKTSVADPDPSDPNVLGLLDPDPNPDPSIITQKVRKTLISTVLWLLFDFLSLKNDINVRSKSNRNLVFCCRLEGQWRK